MGRRRVYQTNAARQRAYRLRKKRRERNIFWSEDEWETPPDLYERLNREFRFTIDVAANSRNAKCDRFFSAADDGLRQTWSGTCWMNPPYDHRLELWLRKAFESARAGEATVVALLPARTSSRWWHEVVLPSASEIRFVRGRLRFGSINARALFPSVIVVFRCNGEAGSQFEQPDLNEMRYRVFATSWAAVERPSSPRSIDRDGRGRNS